MDAEIAPPKLFRAPREASQKDLAWVHSAIDYLGPRLQSAGEWQLLGGQLRAIDENLLPQWWALRPQEYRQPWRKPRLEWSAFPASPQGGMLGLWKWASLSGCPRVSVAPDAPFWTALEECLRAADLPRYCKEFVADHRAYRALKELSMWCLAAIKFKIRKPGKGQVRELLDLSVRAEQWSLRIPFQPASVETPEDEEEESEHAGPSVRFGRYPQSGQLHFVK